MCPFYVVAPPVADQQQQQRQDNNAVLSADQQQAAEDGDPEATDAESYGHHLHYGRLVAIKRTWETWNTGGGAAISDADHQPTSDHSSPTLINEQWRHNGDDDIDHHSWHHGDAIPVGHPLTTDHQWHSDAMPDYAAYTTAVDQPAWSSDKTTMPDHFDPSLPHHQPSLITNMTPIKHPTMAHRMPSPMSPPQSATLPRTHSTPARPWTPTMVTTSINTAPSFYGQGHQQLPTPPATPSPRGKTATTTEPSAMLADYSWRVTKSGDRRQIDESDNWVVPFSWRQRPPVVHFRVSSSVRNWTELERWEREVAQRRPERGPRRGKSPPRYGRYAEFVEPKMKMAQQQQRFDDDQAMAQQPMQQQQQFAKTYQQQQRQVEAVHGGKQFTGIAPQQRQESGEVQQPLQQQQQLGAVQLPQQQQQLGAVQPPQQQQQLGAVQPPQQQQQVGAVQLPQQQQQFGAVQPPQQKQQLGAVQPPQQKQQQQFGAVQPPQQKQQLGSVQPPQQKQQQQFGAVQPPQQKQQLGSVQPPQQKQQQQFGAVQPPQQRIGAVQGTQQLTRIAPQRPHQRAVQSPQLQNGVVQPLQQQFAQPSQQRIGAVQPAQQQPGVVQQPQKQLGAVPLPRAATPLPQQQRQVVTANQQQLGTIQGQLPRFPPQQQYQKQIGTVQFAGLAPQQQPQIGTVQGSQTLPRMTPQRQQQQVGTAQPPQQQQFGAVQPRMEQQQPQKTQIGTVHLPAAVGQQNGAVQSNQQQLLPPQKQQQQQQFGQVEAENDMANHWEWQERVVQLPADYDEEAPNATMETKVSGGGAAPKRVGRWTLSQLRQTDGIIPSQAGWNKGDSQKLMTNFGTPRNTTTKVKVENLAEIPEEVLLKGHGEVRLQSGTNRFASQKGFVAFGTGRDVCREGVNVNVLPGDLEPLPEEKIRASDGIVRLQAGTNKFDSQKGMTLFGTGRRETTKMKDTKHPEYSHERDIDNTEIPLQMGTNKFASQKGMTGFGTNRRETTKMLDTSHPEYSHEQSIDQTSIPYQMGSNKYASQKGMTGFGQPRWEVLDPSISYQNRKSQGMVRLQSGTNRFASQAGMTGFGTVRNTTYEAEAGELPYEDMKKSEAIIPSQAGWNKGDSQKMMTNFGTPRDVKGKHLKRIWELEYPEEAEVSLDRL